MYGFSKAQSKTAHWTPWIVDAVGIAKDQVAGRHGNAAAAYGAVYRAAESFMRPPGHHGAVAAQASGTEGFWERPERDPEG